MPDFKNFITKLKLVEYWRSCGMVDHCEPLGDNDFTWVRMLWLGDLLVFAHPGVLHRQLGSITNLP
ncbi:MAG: hypothetical protein KJN72_00960 [Woeseia sp.]|nr:hypothetical protein [Woeseia sp.]